MENHDMLIESQAEELKLKARTDSERYDQLFKVGTEVEACLLDDKGNIVNASPLIEELLNSQFFRDSNCMIDYEYGSCQFEFKTPPLSFTNLSDLEILYEDFIIDHLEKAIQKVYKNKMVIPVFLGANPSPNILKDTVITDKDRYKKLFEWQNKFSDIELEGRKFKAAHIPAAIQGFHFHLQGRNPTYAVWMFNHILNLLSSVIVLGANSKLFAGKVFSFHEPRIFLYDHSEQQNSGFPAIVTYPKNIDDYIDYIKSRKPIIAKDYFELEKERHDDVRIRLNSEYYRVETRIVSVQTAPKALMAMIEFFVGYLSKVILEESNGSKFLRNLSILREERQASVQSGFDAASHFPLIDTIKVQLEYAKKGLLDLNIKPEFLNILEERVKNKTSPSEYVANLWDKKFNGSIDQTVVEIIFDIWERTKHNRPIM
ncbi:MAG TPA: glutamate-cysteine ligase family protein [Nitrososphaeraceae archaeon]|nr:glutamate-cysteine ligase family protein [Nitrososphaeraceae archaeon]